MISALKNLFLASTLVMLPWFATACSAESAEPIAMDRTAIIAALAAGRTEVANGLSSVAERWLEARTMFPSSTIAVRLLRPASMTLGSSTQAMLLDCELALINLRLDAYAATRMAGSASAADRAVASAIRVLMGAHADILQRYSASMALVTGHRPLPTPEQLTQGIRRMASDPLSTAFKQELSPSDEQRLRSDFARMLDSQSATIANAIRRDAALAAANRPSLLADLLRQCYHKLAKATTPEDLRSDRIKDTILPGWSDYHARRSAYQAQVLAAENAAMHERQRRSDAVRDAAASAAALRVAAPPPQRPPTPQPQAQAASATTPSPMPATLPDPWTTRFRWPLAIGAGVLTAVVVAWLLRPRRPGRRN